MRHVLAAALLGLLSWAPAAAQEKNPVVVLETSLGTIKIELEEKKAPVTVKNFLDYVDAKFYDGTIFHRVIPNFMIQGGGLEPGLQEKKTRPPIKNEGGNGLVNDRGTIAMARTDDPNSATAQFLINLKHSKDLDRANAEDNFGYAVFGRVVEGMDVVDKIAQVQTKKTVPVQDIVIKSARRVPK